MAQFPALPLFTDAYLADTRHLSTEQHGAYLLLLMEAWRRPACSLPDDDELLARLACMSMESWQVQRATVMAFWKLDGRKKEWTQSRLTDEREYVRQKSRSQSHKAASRWKNKEKWDAAAMPEGMPEGMPEACPDDAPTPTPTIVSTNVLTSSEPAVSNGSGTRKGKAKSAGYSPEFEAFWIAYPSTKGQSKLDGFKAWQKLSEEDQAQAVASLPAYAAELKAESWRKVKHVQGYLNHRYFETFGPLPSQPIDWVKRLTYGRQWRQWPVHQWGPMPGTTGCRVPSDLLASGDGDGWAVARAA
jgi:uncharacterized protein YdaU (DUF1376 family)